MAGRGWLITTGRPSLCRLFCRLSGWLVEAVEQKKKFVRGRVERILQAAPERVAARCPHFGVCGGCDYQHIAYEAQLKFKSDILRETLRRIGKIEWTAEITAHGSPAVGLSQSGAVEGAAAGNSW